ncbi:RagB/SusD domain-containing protein [Moritella viscosa]|uniref:hypothetical protein n=1 Tax=Moritella viscosa TaxID=80854 RepID=UPI0009188CB5|nr:hypothetical protein [Moritella viscosa]SHO23864.1 RagB/SusD domain-containing protein [Moritella viscosa]
MNKVSLLAVSVVLALTGCGGSGDSDSDSTTVSVFSASEAFVENQGDKPEVFSSQIFAGQWVLDNYKKASPGLKERPSFTNIEQADIVNIDAKISSFAKSGDRTERMYAIKVKDEVIEGLATANHIDYINKNFTNDNIKKSKKRKVKRKIQKAQAGFIKDNDENTILLNHYNKNHIISANDVFVLMNYRDIETLSPRYTGWIQSIKDLEEEKGFDLSESVDFFMISSGAGLFGIDVVSNDEFILYSVQRGVAVNYLRSDENIIPVTTSSLFDVIEGK